jgi:ADP-ribose pyrophosphatase YjhB (NUDIX family)
VLNLLARCGYRGAYLIARAWWFIRRPQTFGAAVAIWCGDQLLLVRTSYRQQLSLPGGFLKRHEAALTAAVRELAEELDLHFPPSMLARRWHGTTAFERRVDTTTIWEVVVDHPPIIQLNAREIVWVDWCTANEALARALCPPVRAYLTDRVTNNPPPGTHVSGNSD